MTSPLLLHPSAPPHDDFQSLPSPYHPPFPPMPEAHPLATATAVLAPAASEEGEGAQPINVDEPARKKAEALAAARVQQERAKAVLAGREVSVSHSMGVVFVGYGCVG